MAENAAAVAVDWEALASHGHAPVTGCSVLGVGYEDAFETLVGRYIDGRFPRGLSSEKVVVGPFGSGKTHFLRQMIELAAARGCVVAEVRLNKDLDFTKRLVVYEEIAQGIQAPDQPDHGVAGLIRAMHGRIGEGLDDSVRPALVDAWVDGISAADLKSDAFARVTQTALRALQQHDESTFIAAGRWLGGEISDPQLTKVLPVGSVAPAQRNLAASHMLLSLFQLVRLAGYTGTVVALDEAEQGFSVDRKRLDRILSMLMSDVNAIADLSGGSVLMLYAITPDIRERMNELPPLQQRFADPGGVGFFDGNYVAPVIDLAFRQDPRDHLRRIARRLVEVYAQTEPLPLGSTEAAAVAHAESIADAVAATDQSSSSRRVLVKRVTAFLLGIPEAAEPTSTPEF